MKRVTPQELEAWSHITSFKDYEPAWFFYYKNESAEFHMDDVRRLVNEVYKLKERLDQA